jgi:hypothetical protein
MILERSIYPVLVASFAPEKTWPLVGYLINTLVSQERANIQNPEDHQD